MYWSPIQLDNGNPRSPYFCKACTAEGYTTWNALIETLSAPEKGAIALNSTSLSVEKTVLVE